MAETALTYDLRGLKCPLVLLKTRRKKRSLPLGTTLVILSDDPLAPLDIANYCQHNRFAFSTRHENGIDYMSII